MNLKDLFLTWANKMSDQGPPDPLSYQSETGMMLWTALAGIVLTTLFGALIQNHFAKKEYERQKRKDQEEENRRDRLTGLHLNIKLKITADRLYSLMGDWLSCIAETRTHRQMALWQRLKPLSGLPAHPLQFDLDEIALILRAKNPELANKLLWMNEKAISVLDVLKEYNRRRIDLEDILPASPNNPVGSIELEERHAFALAPRFIALQDVAVQLCDAVIEDFDFCLTAIENIEPILKDYFQDPDYKAGNFNESARVRRDEFVKAMEEHRSIGGIGLTLVETP